MVAASWRTCGARNENGPSLMMRNEPLTWVGLGGLEPPTSSLSGKRSNRLSYRPSGAACTGKFRGTAALDYRNRRLVRQSVSLRVTSMPPATCVTRL